jgi:WD40 repeat protein
MESSPVNYMNFDNHKNNDTLDNEPKNYKFCKHIRDKFFNNFTTKPNLQKTNNLNTTEKNSHSNNYSNNSLQMQSFFNLPKLSSTGSSHHIMRNYFDSFYIKNLNLDWIALDNPQNLSFTSINRDGCLFTIAFDDSGEYMASSNHNHHIEIWNTNPSKRKIIKTIKDHKEIVTGLEFFHGDSSYMMSCSLDKTIQLWKDFENVHTFLDHSDWVRCLSLSKDNKHFLSGCVSSVVKLWDLETQTVVKTINNQNPDPDLLNTVNSLMFMNTDDHIFLCGLRNGTVKLFDTRVDNFNHLTREFKAHKNKLNSIKFNHNDKYLLSSGRDSLCRLWDMRKLPIGENPDLNANYCVNEYKGHLCKGFNIESNFFCEEKYIVTGSEDSFIYIYDTISSDLVMKYKTNQKCVNLVKPFPMKSQSYSLVYTGLEDISIYVMNTHKVLSKNVEKIYSCRKEREGKESDVIQDSNYSEYDEILNVEEKEQNKHMKLIEEIMSECGDLILRIFHSNNLTYSNGMNFEHLMEIIQRNNDEESLRIMQIVSIEIYKYFKKTF